MAIKGPSFPIWRAPQRAAASPSVSRGRAAEAGGSKTAAAPPAKTRRRASGRRRKQNGDANMVGSRVSDVGHLAFLLAVPRQCVHNHFGPSPRRGRSRSRPTAEAASGQLRARGARGPRAAAGQRRGAGAGGSGNGQWPPRRQSASAHGAPREPVSQTAPVRWRRACSRLPSGHSEAACATTAPTLRPSSRSYTLAGGQVATHGTARCSAGRVGTC